MREQRLLAGGKRWHGTDFLDLEMEALDPLQKFFEPYGNVIISGCGITYGGGTYTINSGYIGCMHADGYKIAKIATTNIGAAPFPLYLYINKTTESKLYDDAVTRLSVEIYTGATTGTTPGAGLYITVLSMLPTAAPRWKETLLAKSAWQYAHSGLGTFVFMNGFGDGYALTSPQDNFRTRFDLSGNVWLSGALDYTPLGAGPFASPGLQITRLEPGYRPDRAIIKTIVLALPGGTATIQLRLNTDGRMYAEAIAFGGGVTHSDIPSGSPFGEFFEWFYPGA